MTWSVPLRPLLITLSVGLSLLAVLYVGMWRLSGSDPDGLLLGYAPSLGATGIAPVACVSIHTAAAEPRVTR